MKSKPGRAPRHRINRIRAIRVRRRCGDPTGTRLHRHDYVAAPEKSAALTITKGDDARKKVDRAIILWSFNFNACWRNVVMLSGMSVDTSSARQNEYQQENGNYQISPSAFLQHHTASMAPSRRKSSVFHDRSARSRWGIAEEIIFDTCAHPDPLPLAR